MRRRSAVRFGWLALAASCRRKPSGSYPRSQLRPGDLTHIFLVEREAVRADEPEGLHGRGNGRGPAACHAPPQQPGVNPGFGLPHPAGPGGGHHQRQGANPGSVLQRDGLRDEPPDRRPDQMHRTQPQAIDEPGHIRGHVADRVRRRPAPYHDVGQARRREVPQVGRFAPTSRLSNRTTKRPRRARPSHSSSGQAIICVARPMMSTTGGAPASPNVSYASSMPFAATRPSVRAATSSMAAVSHAISPRSLPPRVTAALYARGPGREMTVTGGQAMNAGGLRSRTRRSPSSVHRYPKPDHGFRQYI